jgi:hypothetical protein
LQFFIYFSFKYIYVFKLIISSMFLINKFFKNKYYLNKLASFLNMYDTVKNIFFKPKNNKVYYLNEEQKYALSKRSVHGSYFTYDKKNYKLKIFTYEECLEFELLKNKMNLKEFKKLNEEVKNKLNTIRRLQFNEKEIELTIKRTKNETILLDKKKKLFEIKEKLASKLHEYEHVILKNYTESAHNINIKIDRIQTNAQSNHL